MLIVVSYPKFAFTLRTLIRSVIQSVVRYPYVTDYVTKVLPIDVGRILLVALGYIVFVRGKCQKKNIVFWIMVNLSYSGVRNLKQVIERRSDLPLRCLLSKLFPFCPKMNLFCYV